jgi:hypothetical protein
LGHSTAPVTRSGEGLRTGGRNRAPPDQRSQKLIQVVAIPAFETSGASRLELETGAVWQ